MVFMILNFLENSKYHKINDLSKYNKCFDVENEKIAPNIWGDKDSLESIFLCHKISYAF